MKLNWNSQRGDIDILYGTAQLQSTCTTELLTGKCGSYMWVIYSNTTCTLLYVQMFQTQQIHHKLLGLFLPM